MKAHPQTGPEEGSRANLSDILGRQYRSAPSPLADSGSYLKPHNRVRLELGAVIELRFTPQSGACCPRPDLLMSRCVFRES